MPTAVVQQEWNESLWNTYVAKHDPKLREQIIVQYAPLVKYVVERLDPTRGIKFETYAIARIRGAIIDALRSLDQIPRTARQRAREIEAAIVELESKLKRPPYDEEVAAHLGLEVDKYREACVRTNVST